MDQEEIRWSALSDLACLWLVEDLTRLPGDRRERLPWLEPASVSASHLPCEGWLARPGFTAEIRARAARPPHGQADAAASRLPAFGDPLTPLGTGESARSWSFCRRSSTTRARIGSRRVGDAALLHQSDAVRRRARKPCSMQSTPASADAAAAEPAGMRRHLRPALVYGRDDAPHLVGRPRRHVGVRLRR
jgi:hypothetical protein